MRSDKPPYDAMQAALDTLDALEHPLRHLWSNCLVLALLGLAGGLVAAALFILVLLSVR